MTAPIPHPPAQRAPSRPWYPTELDKWRQRRRDRASALDMAVQFHDGYHDSSADVIETADLFYGWLTEWNDGPSRGAS